MRNLSLHSKSWMRLVGACLTSLSLLLAACSAGDEPPGDSAVVTDSATGGAPAPDTATMAPSTPAAPAAPAPAKTAPDTAKASAPTRTPSASAARTKADTTTKSTASGSNIPTPRPGMRPVARDTAPGMMVPTPEKTSEPAPSTSTQATQTPAQQPAQQSTQQPTQQASGQANLMVSQSEYNGWKTFAVNCTRCHGEDAIGSALAPSLVKSLQGPVNHDVFMTTVKNGRPEKGMPAWGSLMTDAQIEDMWAYLKARADGRLAAGRPRVRSGG